MQNKREVTLFFLCLRKRKVDQVTSAAVKKCSMVMNDSPRYRRSQMWLCDDNLLTGKISLSKKKTLEVIKLQKSAYCYPKNSCETIPFLQGSSRFVSL